MRRPTTPALIRPLRAALAAVTIALVAAPPASAAPDAEVVALARRIEAFGFDTCMRMGIGGFLAVSTCPVVLFKDGALLSDLEALLQPAALQAHKARHPDSWTRWRRQGGELQVERKAGWKALGFQTTYASLPKDFRLDGRYRALSGAGTLAVGGTDAVAAWRDYRFHADGRIEHEGGVGGRSEFGNASVATRHAAAGRQGRYRIDGLLLVITWDDGAIERSIVVTDPRDAKGAIWLDGVGFVRR
jgi:hypothetical protein